MILYDEYFIYSSISFSSTFHVISRKFELLFDSVRVTVAGSKNLAHSARLSQGWAYVLFKRMQRSCVLLRSFQKNATFSRSFAFFIKRALLSLRYFTFFIKRTLRSFKFFMKECGVLCVLLHSL